MQWWESQYPDEQYQRENNRAERTTYDRYRRAATARHLPLGSAGPWELSRTVPTEAGASWQRLRSVVTGSGRGLVRAGEPITMLRRNGTLVMSDTPDELRDAWRFVARAYGRVLVNGLGLGCTVRGLLANPQVEHITVVEISPELVQQLVGPTLLTAVYQGRLELVVEDAYTVRWERGRRWSCAWHDVWDYITLDNDYATLHRRYGGRVEWQESWGREEARRYAARSGAW